MVTEAQKETVKTEEAKPKIEDSPEFHAAVKAEVSKATSRYQQQASEAKRETKKIASQISSLQEQMEQAKQDAEIARLAGDDVDAASRLKEQLKLRDEIDKRNKQLSEREERVTELERRSSIRLLHEQYGIPVGDLEEYETLAEMRVAAVEYENTQLKAARKPGGAKEEEERESKPIDTAEGRIAGLTLPKPGTKEFEETLERVKAGFSR